MVPTFPEINQALMRLGGEQLVVSSPDLVSQSLYLVGQNIILPGSFATALEQQRAKTADNRDMPVMYEGKALALLHRMAYEFPNLIDGVPNEALSEYQGYSPHDERRKEALRQISRAVYRAWGLRMERYQGMFRLLTVRQFADKTSANGSRALTTLESIEQATKELGALGVQPRSIRRARFTEAPLFDMLPQALAHGSAADD